MKKKTCLTTAGFLVLLSALAASAQPRDIGKFDTWTTKVFARKHELSEVTHIRQVRADRQKGFDRVVFEFDGSTPNYEIKYLPSRFYENEAGKQRIKIAGNAFIQVELSLIPFDDRQDEFVKSKGFAPQGRLNFISLREIDDEGFFEGFFDFLLGISSRKVFRVSELSNPARLVIDCPALRHHCSSARMLTSLLSKEVSISRFATSP